ncbi:MAG: hypothetical protein ACI93R_001237 [Flavobacteriales bacterium]|jgi:hypothetical protein
MKRGKLNDISGESQKIFQNTGLMRNTKGVSDETPSNLEAFLTGLTKDTGRP